MGKIALRYNFFDIRRWSQNELNLYLKVPLYRDRPWFSQQCVILNNAFNMKNYYFSLVIPTMHILNLCNSRNTKFGSKQWQPILGDIVTSAEQGKFSSEPNFTVSDSNEYIPAWKQSWRVSDELDSDDESAPSPPPAAEV